jgi:hypothetical protein
MCTQITTARRGTDKILIYQSVVVKVMIAICGHFRGESACVSRDVAKRDSGVARPTLIIRGYSVDTMRMAINDAANHLRVQESLTQSMRH